MAAVNPVLLDPVAQRLVAEPELAGDLVDRPARRPYQRDRVTLELRAVLGWTSHPSPLPLDLVQCRGVHPPGGTSELGAAPGPPASALVGCRLPALATGGLLLRRGAALPGVAAPAGGLAAVLGGVRRVGDPCGALLGHALVAQRLVLVLVPHIGRLGRHRRHSPRTCR